MYAKKYWTPECISWKDFYWECYRHLDKIALDCGQEEFEDYSVNKTNTQDFLEPQEEGEPFIDRCTGEEWEKIMKKCNEVYEEAYCDVWDEYRRECGWRDYNY